MHKFCKHKYHAQPTTVDNIRYGSKKEATYAGQLKILKQNGDILFFIRQVPFHLPGNIIYRLDFMEFWAPKDENPGDIKFVEIKGFETKEWKIKKKLVESLYPITIDVK